MALLEPGYWPSTYWPSRYWPTNPQYWPEYAAAAAEPTSAMVAARIRRRKPRPLADLSLEEVAAAMLTALE